jgi:bifunctional non-homologous end joining protein LigD
MRPGDWLYEIKFDGYRALPLRGGSVAGILSRNESDLGTKFTEVRDSVAALDVRDRVLNTKGGDRIPYFCELLPKVLLVAR